MTTTYVKNMAGKTIICDKVIELSKMKRVERPRIIGSSTSMLGRNYRPERKLERKAEEERGYLTEEERVYMTQKYLPNIEAWNNIISRQVYKLKITADSFETYKRYLDGYNALRDLLISLESAKPNANGVYDISTLHWCDIWNEHFDSCDAFDLAIFNYKKTQNISEVITLYMISKDEHTAPAHTTAEDIAKWTRGDKPKKNNDEAIWAMWENHYGDGAITYGVPYVLENIGSSSDANRLSITLNTDTIKWTKRGVKKQGDIIATANYKGEIPFINWSLDKTNVGVSILQTDKKNTIRITTPLYESEMLSNEVTIEVFVNENGDEKRASATIKKSIVGDIEPVYLGVSNKLPTAYIHDGINDHLITKTENNITKGDWFLCTDENFNDQTLKYGVVYELVDMSAYTTIRGWREVNGSDEVNHPYDKEMLSACLSDMNKLDPSKTEGTDIKGYTWFLKGLTALNVNVNNTLDVQGNSTLSNTTINGNLDIQGSITIGGVPAIDLWYPIGSIFTTIDVTNPSVKFRLLGPSVWELVGQGRCLWGAKDEQDLGEIEAGLPNIKGEFVAQDQQVGVPPNGAFDVASRGTVDGGTSRSNQYALKRIFDASKGQIYKDENGTEHYISAYKGEITGYEDKQIYGKSNTVQPPALKVFFYKRVG